MVLGRIDAAKVRNYSSKKMEELHQRDDAAISAGNSNFYGKTLLLELIQRN